MQLSAPARRYVDWLARHGVAIVLVWTVVLGVSCWLAAHHLPLRSDFSDLLPQESRSVQDLRKLESRVTAPDTMLVLVVADDPRVRAAVTAELAAAIRAMPSSMIKGVEVDDLEARTFLREHRHLLVPYEELVAARNALAKRIERAKLDANPLFIRLDDDANDELKQLRDRHAEATERLDRSGYVSRDGRIQLIVVRTAFTRSDVHHGEELIAAIEHAKRDILAAPERAHVQVGLATGVVSAVAEHHALVRGMLLSSVITALLVAVVLIWFFHSVRLLAMLSTTLIAGTVAAFGAAAFTVGHLNVATAFLGAIIAGNGVNYGILLIARLRHEDREGDRAGAIARAIQCTLRPTLIASLGASIAYGSLAATSFQGFADFALIGGVGMILCWLASYTLLPVLLLRWHVRRPVRRSQLGEVLVQILAGRRAGIVCGIAALAIALSGWLSYRYIAHDPFEYDMKKLRSGGAEALAARRWVKLADDTFGRGIAGQTFIAVDRIEQVRLVVDALRDADPQQHTIGTIHSILDVVPECQIDKLAVLADIRTLLDDPALEALPEADKAELRTWRPPDGLAPITIDSLPADLARRLREQDGRVGLLIGVRPAATLDEWDGHGLIRFANAVRRIVLRDGETVTTSGTHVIYADIIASLRGDGPRVIAVAAICLIAMVLIVGGRNRRSLIVLAATGTGSLLLVGICALINLKVTFLDFVALPITLGLGVDYAINMADQPDASDTAATLRTSGAAVLVCSLTTMIGYGSLLVSDNRAIQAFGLASLIGELCCVATALTLVPALLGITRRRYRTGAATPAAARRFHKSGSPLPRE